MANTCKDNCTFAIFCPSFGEYKCTLKQRRIYDSKKICSEYSAKHDNVERKCHCLVCVSNGYVEYDDD